MNKYWATGLGLAALGAGAGAAGLIPGVMGAPAAAGLGGGMTAGGGLTGMALGAGGATGLTAPASALASAGAAGAAAPSVGLLAPVTQSLVAAQAARGLLGSQQQPIQAQPVMQAQGGPQVLQGIAAQGDQLSQQRLQSDEQARQQRRMAMIQGVRNGRLA